MSDRAFTASPALFLPAPDGLRGTIRVPGDKSVSHRAVLLGAVSAVPVHVTGFLRSADTLASVEAVRALGITVDDDGDSLLVHGAGWEGLTEPGDVIDVANSGTLIRLLPGLVAGRDIFCVLTGDDSIRRRPMARVLKPLAEMGVRVNGRAGASLPPISIRGGRLRAGVHQLEVASAQVKSCLLLAGLQAEGPTVIEEPGESRDHTERMIRQAGGRAEREGEARGRGRVRVWPAKTLTLAQVDVPGDFSSAAFFLVAALIVPGSEVTIEGVGLNPTRTGLLTVLQRMGADLQVEVTDADAPEPVGNVTVRYCELVATDVDHSEVPNLIDELPAFMLAAAKAQGTSTISGAGELRVKESDRLAGMGRLLQSLGVSAMERPDGLVIKGRPNGWQGGEVQAEGDHRLAMVGAIAGSASSAGVRVDDIGCMGVSFPGFVDVVSALGGRWESERSHCDPEVTT